MGTTAQKLQRVLDTKEGLKDTINTYLGQDITSAIPFKDYETYIKNFYGVLPKTDYAEGSNITLENCLKGKLDYEDDKVGYGDTKQESTTGKNLFGFNVSATDVTTTYRPTANQRLDVTGINLNEVKFNYRLGSYARAYLEIDGIDGTLDYYFSFVVKKNTTSYTPTMVKDTTNSTNTKLIITISGGNGTTAVDYAEYFILSNIMVSTAGGDYEPYTGGIPAPNPSYKQDIQVVTGEQEVVVRGKNLFNINDTYYTQNSTATIIGNNIKVEAKLSTSNGFTWYNIPVIKNKEITISYGDITESSSSGNNRLQYGFSDTPMTTYDSTLTTNISRTDKNVTANVTGNYLILLIRVGSGLYQTTSNIQVEYGNSATTYEPYITPITKQLSLGDKELYEDSFISKENGTWYFNDNYIRYNGKLTYTSFNTDYNRLNASYSISNPATFNTASMFYCNITSYVGGSVNKTNPNASMQLRGQQTTNACYIWLDDITTSEQAQTFLTNTDFNIVSATAETIKTPITDTNLINQLEDIYNMQSVNGTTIIEINGNLPMIIKCRALKGE